MLVLRAELGASFEGTSGLAVRPIGDGMPADGMAMVTDGVRQLAPRRVLRAAVALWLNSVRADRIRPATTMWVVSGIV